MKIKTMYIAFALFALAALSVPAYAANPQLITSASALQDWLPLAFLAVVVGLMINAIYYVVASIINNKRAKSTAVAELWQSIASAVFVIVIIGVITLVGTSAISFTSILSQSSLTSLCAHLSGSQLSIVNPSYAPTFDICSQINSSLSSLTTSVDYGLISSYMIVANLTNQSATNLNSLYVYSGWIGFLTDFQARTYVCWPSACLAPGAALGEINTSYSPLAGYEDISNFIKPVQLEAGLSFYLLAMQLILITFFLYAWPYLLAAGIILRASFFTRSLGGLLMAISLSALLIFPVMYMIEYSAFTNLSLGPIGTSNSIPAIQTMALYEQQPNGTVSVYGSNSFGGYTNLNNLVGQPGNHAECLPSGVRTQYVYESQCGNPATAGVCTSRLPAGAQLCPTSGYVPALQASNSGCSPSQYAYESTCGDPNSVSSNPAGGEPQCSSSPPDSQMCVAPLHSNVNFFVLPRADGALRYYGCMPGNLIADELAFATPYLFGAGLIGEVISGRGGLAGQLPATTLNLEGGCTPTSAVNSALALTNLYGVMFITAIIFPILNILIAIASMISLSKLFGGYASLVGLEKLI